MPKSARYALDFDVNAKLLLPLIPLYNAWKIRFHALRPGVNLSTER